MAWPIVTQNVGKMGRSSNKKRRKSEIRLQGGKYKYRHRKKTPNDKREKTIMATTLNDAKLKGKFGR